MGVIQARAAQRSSNRVVIRPPPIVGVSREAPSPSTQPGALNDLVSRVSESATTENVSLPDGPCSPRCSHASEPKAQPSTVSPLDILASAVAAVSGDSDIDSAPQMLASPSQSPLYSCGDLVGSSVSPASADCPFLGYFGPQSPKLQKDWQVLSLQSVESIFKLESSACDPVAARLIDEADVNYLFNLFFTVRNPLLWLLDPELHTPEHVYASSFTLFSAICCLGCAVSSRPRDRVIHAALLSLAEANMKWSIAVSVRGVEIIQAIVLMQYWAPMRTRYSSDPSSLHLSHAAQLARELAIYDPGRIDNYLAASIPTAADDLKERFRRNFERTWFCIFIADQSFGVVHGRRLGVSWNEISPGAFHWWQKPMTNPYDRIVSGIVETRGILVRLSSSRCPSAR
ncbi:hypothetical protein F5144DRAFT_497283 [Chaetomium tenue]|uniref:Uncharacterized protein n=1 Tax=Chaetomium tenue TaxID=1854479 RepID=A0ACB7NZW3_9PEZI|nr:hypothetical protein F5144DRAFT_497283 [Chaetomium globosum]